MVIINSSRGIKSLLKYSNYLLYSISSVESIKNRMLLFNFINQMGKEIKQVVIRIAETPKHNAYWLCLKTYLLETSLSETKAAVS